MDRNRQPMLSPLSRNELWVLSHSGKEDKSVFAVRATGCSGVVTLPLLNTRFLSVLPYPILLTEAGDDSIEILEEE